MKRLKIGLLYVASLVLSCLPVLIYFFLNFDRYVKTTPQAVRLSVGAIILLFILALKTVGKLKMPSRIVTFSVVLLLSYLLESVLSDLIIFSLLALIGEALDLILQAIIRSQREKIKLEKIREETERAVNNCLDNRVRRV
ncbi:MAG: hypothetical protein IJW54_04655 [Clostridia bacterium]|nr:hypothetical protein [Clostridia bacterium]